MPQHAEGSPPNFKDERIAHLFELVRERLPYQHIPVDEDADGAAALVNVIVYAQEYAVQTAKGESESNPVEVTKKRQAILGFHLVNYLEGLSPHQMADRALELKTHLMRECAPNRHSAHLTLTPYNVEAMLERTADFLAGHLRNKRYGRDIRKKNGIHLTADMLAEQAATAELAKKRSPAKTVASRYGAILGLTQQEQLGLYYLLSHRSGDDISQQQKLILGMILGASSKAEQVSWTEQEQARVEALIKEGRTLQQQAAATPRNRRQRAELTVQQELLGGMHKLADAIDSLKTCHRDHPI